jgi:hypothetical protein
LLRLNKTFGFLNKLQIRPNLHKSQNLFFSFAMKKKNEKENKPDWIREFVFLGLNLGVRIEF